MSVNNLAAMFSRVDKIDFDEGLLAYQRYHLVMQALADLYGFTLTQVVSAFVSLSPNSDYYGNLRSTVSVLQGINQSMGDDDIVVSTYNHCKHRALAYARGEKSFLQWTKGLKILNFYHNILDPLDDRHCTIDGHMSAIWQGRMNMTMKEALIKPAQYTLIKEAVTAFAYAHHVRPCEMQAMLWFTRKRVCNVVYDPQLNIFAQGSDVWNTLANVKLIRPYLKTERAMIEPKGEADPYIDRQFGLFPEMGS